MKKRKSFASKIKKLSFLRNPLLYLWPLAVLPKTIVLVISLLLLVFFLCKGALSNKRLTKTSKILIALGSIQLLAILVAVIIHEPELERIFAGINTALIWIVAGLFFTLFYVNRVKVNEVTLGKTALFNISVLFTLTIIGIVCGLLKTNIHIGNRFLLNDDWKNGVLTFRTCCFFEYPTLIPYFLLVNLPFAIKYIVKKNFFTKTSLFGVSLISVYFSKSRWGLLIFAFVYFMMICHYFMVRHKLSGKQIFLRVLVLVAFASPFIVYLALDILSSRTGSNSMRLAIYSTSIMTTLERNILFGNGVKYFFHEYPLGSHSSVIGSFYKTGIIGFVLFLVLYIKAIIISFKCFKNNPAVSATLLAILLFMIFEDIDGTNWLLIYFCFLYSGIKRRSVLIKEVSTNRIYLANIFESPIPKRLQTISA